MALNLKRKIHKFNTLNYKLIAVGALEEQFLNLAEKIVLRESA